MFRMPHPSRYRRTDTKIWSAFLLTVCKIEFGLKNPFVVSPYNDTIEGFLPLSLVKIGSITEFYHSWNRSIVPKRNQCIGLDRRSLTTCRQTNSTKLILKLASLHVLTPTVCQVSSTFMSLHENIK